MRVMRPTNVPSTTMGTCSRSKISSKRPIGFRRHGVERVLITRLGAESLGVTNNRQQDVGLIDDPDNPSLSTTGSRTL